MNAKAPSVQTRNKMKMFLFEDKEIRYKYKTIKKWNINLTQSILACKDKHRSCTSSKVHTYNNHKKIQ